MRLIVFDEDWQPVTKRPHRSLKKEFAHLLPDLRALSPISSEAKLRPLLENLHDEENPIPPFRIHPLAIFPCAILGIAILTRSINEDLNSWIIIASRGFELLAAIVTGVAISLWLWLYTQKRSLTVFCFVVSIPLAWNIPAIHQAHVEEKEYIETQQRSEVLTRAAHAYDQWARSHKAYQLWDKNSESDELILRDLITNIDLLAGSAVEPRTRNLAKLASRVFTNLAKASIRYKESVHRFNALDTAGYGSLRKRVDVEQRLTLLSDVQSRLEELRESMNRMNTVMGEAADADTISSDLKASLIDGFLDDQHKLWDVTDSLLRLLLTEWPRWKIDHEGNPEFESPYLNTEFMILSGEREALKIRIAVHLLLKEEKL